MFRGFYHTDYAFPQLSSSLVKVLLRWSRWSNATIRTELLFFFLTLGVSVLVYVQGNHCSAPDQLEDELIG